MTKKTTKKERNGKNTALISLPDTYDEQQLIMSNDLVAANYRLSLTQLRLVWMFGMLIRRDDENFRLYQVSIIEVMNYLGLNTRSGKVYEQIEEAVEGLIGNVLHVPRRDGDGWLKFTWVASAEYRGKEGTIEFEFSEKLRPFLLSMTGGFTMLEMSQIMQLRSVYSGRMYILLKQYRKLGRIRFTLEELRLRLSVDSVESIGSTTPYKRFQDFRRFVLESAQKELAEKTDLTFEYKTIKKGRRVREIELLIRSSKPKPTAPSPAIAASLPQSVQRLVEAGFKERHALSLWLKKWANVAQDVREEIDENLSFEDYVVEKLSLLRKYRTKRLVDNPAGWIVKAIRENWTDGTFKRPRVRRTSSSGKVESISELIEGMMSPDNNLDT